MRANMLYDLAGKPPPAGSLLESIFLLVTKRRQEAGFLQTRVLVESVREPHMEKSHLKDAFQDYVDAMFPYMKDTRSREDEESRKLLEAWTKKGALKVVPLWRAQDHKSVYSRMKRSAESIRRTDQIKKAHRRRI